MGANNLWLFRISAITLVILVTFFLSEFILRLINPDIAAKDIDQLKVSFYGEKNKVTIRNLQGTSLSNPKLDTLIYKSTNKIRFRGPDLPLNNAGLYKIIAVGGSTAICDYLSDGQDWPNLVGSALYQTDSSIWMNNAGIDGHSTFGHIKILPEIILPKRPQMVLFLVGCNDVFRNSIGSADTQEMGLLQREIHTSRFIYDHSYVYRFCSNLFFYLRNKSSAKRFKVYHQNIDFKKVGQKPTDIKLMSDKLQKLRNEYIPSYKERLVTLIGLCKAENTLPVFITQPSVLGNAVDSATGVNLGMVGIDDCNGDMYWNMLELYNQALKDVCRQNTCHFIDLADSMPKNSAYYYDYFHFTKQGSQKAADIITGQLSGIIEADRKK